jgi:phosphatidylglycerophosphate synthase
LKLNFANFLTLLRIAAIPVVVVCFYSPLDYARPIAAVLFGLAVPSLWCAFTARWIMRARLRPYCSAWQL